MMTPIGHEVVYEDMHETLHISFWLHSVALFLKWGFWPWPNLSAQTLYCRYFLVIGKR